MNKELRRYLGHLSAVFFFFFVTSVQAQETQSISRISIKGNKIVSDATVISKIKIRSGQLYNEDIVNDDLKNLYATGFFDTVNIEKDDEPQGIVITFNLKEKPVLRKIKIEGARFIRGKKIEETAALKEGTFVDDYKLTEAVNKIKDIYRQKGFSQVEATYNLQINEETGEAQVTFNINEKRVIKVTRVSVEGNKNIKTGKILKLMKTRKNWLLNWAKFSEDVFSDDVKRIADFYKSQGYSDAKVESETDFNEKGVSVNITINEGTRYYVGTLTVDGNREITLDEIKKAMILKPGEVFSEQSVYEDSSNIREVYVNKGYIFVQIESSNFFNPETKKVDVKYVIVENNIAYVEKIHIKGNVKTKDKVIRRQLRIYPQSKFDGKKVKKSKERLENLGYFDEIRFGTEPGTKPDSVDLTIDVKEAKTGYLSFGGGYSSINEFMGFAELRQRNFDYKNFSTFTGAGQDLSLSVNLGTLTDLYQLSFTNPWIFDLPISFGFDGYKKGHRREESVGYAYSEEIRGGDLRLGKEFNDYIRGQAAYRFDRVEIEDVVESATQELKDEKGVNNLSSAEFDLSFDTRDNVFTPLSGIYFPQTFQVTGGPFGGDKDFFKYSNRFSLFIPMIKKSVTELRLRFGIANPFSDTEKLPIYERFFAGGAQTIRGYSERKVGPVDPVTNDPIGGEALFVGNIEYTYPLLDFLKVATFFDTGNVWKHNDEFFSDDLKSSIGLGVRVKTPIGPVSVDYGWPLNTEPGKEDKKGKFHFSVSKGF